VWIRVVKFIGYTCLTIVIAIGLLAGISYLLQDKIKLAIISQVNEQIAVPISVKGDISLSLIKHFPYASLTLHQVKIASKGVASDSPLLAVEELSFLCNLRSLLTNKIEVSKIRLANGSLAIYTRADGSHNYNILKPTTDTTHTQDIAIQIKEAILDKIAVSYIDDREGLQIDGLARALTLHGDFGAAQYTLDADADMTIAHLTVHGESYLAQANIKTTLALDINKGNSRFEFKDAKLQMGGADINLHGSISSQQSGTAIDINGHSTGDDIATLIGVLPARIRATLAGTSGKGHYTLESTIKGLVSKGLSPAIHIALSLTDARVQLPKLDEPLSHVTAAVVYDVNTHGVDRLIIEPFNSTFSGEPFNLKLHADHLSHPHFTIDADGTADVHQLKALFADKIIEDASGKIKFDHLHIVASEQSIENGDWQSSGNFTLRDIDIRARGVDYTGIGGTIALDGDDLIADSLSVSFLGARSSFTGNLLGLVSYISGLTHREQHGSPLYADGRLTITQLPLSSMIAAYSKPTITVSTSTTTLDPRAVLNIKGKLDIAIGKFTYDQLQLDALAASCQLSPGTITIDRLRCKAMGGEIANHGYITLSSQQEMIIALDLDAQKLDLPTLFKQCKNFDQHTLTDKHLKGLLSAQAQIKTVWTDYRDIDLDQLDGTITCAISQGELNDFEPIRAASKFIRVEELNHIVFSDLSNQISIHKRKITIPQMEIQSSALQLMLSGTHSLDNMIDYHIKVNLRKLLANKFRSHKDENQYIEDDPYEGTNLYLTMTGAASHPSIKYDKASSKKKIIEEFASERNELRNLFKNQKQPPSPKEEKEAKREDKYYDTRQQVKFIDFDEDKSDNSPK
jgi:hypothetical protein